ncbi:MAG: hypothetical protein J6C37_13110 [Roseburia sp.]|nr:hypothetical protein [Roseburia sp.]
MKHYCVISHTHWDREWYQTQEQFRLRLIDLIDHLLEILDKNPDYIFHMDAQTIVLEDYWEIKPEKKELCCQYIREGRLLIGPWYVQNDFFLTSGEATVRNLLLGIHQATELGRCGKTGYAPDQFGLISQLPQILRGFGMDNCVFGRGYTNAYIEEDGTLATKAKPSEFIWKSPDGSGVLAICMSYWYNNAQRFSADIERALRLVEHTKESFEGVATTPYLLLMNGVDHLEPQEDLFPILEVIQKRLPEDEKIYQTSLEHYTELIRETSLKDGVMECTGELKQGMNVQVLKDTASSRIYLKIKNAELQNLLEHRLEPLYTMLELSGMEGVYPAEQLDYLWKMLIRNHAHDSICGCSKDAVHRHMEDRFAAIEEMGLELQRRGMAQLAAHVRGGLEEQDYLIMVFNGLERSRSETVEVTVDIIASDNPSGLRITSPDGKNVPFTVLDHCRINKAVFSPINLPGFLETERYHIRMLAEDIPAFGYAAYRVTTGEKTKETEKDSRPVYMEGQNYSLENRFLKAVISPSGRVSLLHKESGHWYDDCLTVEDVADIGDSYIFMPAPEDAPIKLADFTPEISIQEADAFMGKLRLHYELVLPAYYDRKNQRRSEEKVTIPLDILVSLGITDKRLNVSFRLQNHAKDHRMRVLIRSGRDSSVTVASSPYDLVSRDKWSIDKRICNETEHNSGMVSICSGEIGLSVINRGIYSYENLQSEQGTLAFTIVRSTGRINLEGKGAPEDDSWAAPENQCLRSIQCDLAVLPQCGEDVAVEAEFAAKEFQNPLLVQCEPVDTRKFLGGRPAVQDTGIAELFYRKTPYPECSLERVGWELTLDGIGLQVTALKKAYDRDGYILRFYNAKEEATEAVLNLGRLPVVKVWKTNLRETVREELRITDHAIQVPVKGKEIVTLFMRTN